MHTDIDTRLARVERSNRRYRLALITLGAALAGSVMLGLQPAQKKVTGFTAVMDQAGGMSYFRLIDEQWVEILDTSRGDRWFWRRIRNWPDAN